MSNSPSIIFNCEFCPPEIQSKDNDFYRCKNPKANIVDYMNRAGAADTLEETDVLRISSFVEDTNATGRTIIEFEKNPKGKTGIFSKDPKDTSQTLKNKLQNTPSIVWHSILSFTPEIGNKFCRNRLDAEKIIRTNFPTFFKNAPLNYDNIDWFCCFHTNTTNNHIHLIFWEKSPKIIDSFGNVGYRKKGLLPTKHFDAFKAKIAHYFSKHKLDYFSLRDEIRQGVSSVLKNDKNTFSELLRRASSILADGHFQYARLHAGQRKVIDQFAQLIILNHPQIGEKYKSYKQHLADSQAQYIKLFTDNNIKNIPPNVTNFYSSREQDLNSRLGNALLKQLKEYAFKKNELERSVGYVNGVWSKDSKLSPKSRKAIVSKELSAFASSAMQLFLAEAAPAIEGHLQSDEEFRRQMKAEGKETIYE